MKLEGHRAYKLTIMPYLEKLLILDEFRVKGQIIRFFYLLPSFDLSGFLTHATLEGSKFFIGIFVFSSLLIRGLIKGLSAN